jgi:hypothetical protein
MSERIGDPIFYDANLSWKACHKSVTDLAWCTVTNFVYFRDYGLEFVFSAKKIRICPVGFRVKLLAVFCVSLTFFCGTTALFGSRLPSC